MATRRPASDIRLAAHPPEAPEPTTRTSKSCWLFCTEIPPSQVVLKLLVNGRTLTTATGFVNTVPVKSEAGVRGLFRDQIDEAMPGFGRGWRQGLRDRL